MLHLRGIRVPEDIAVIGFDNVTAAAYSIPALTTIDPGSGQIAKTAVDLLARRITNGPPTHPSEITTDFALVSRRSA